MRRARPRRGIRRACPTNSMHLRDTGAIRCPALRRGGGTDTQDGVLDRIGIGWCPIMNTSHESPVINGTLQYSPSVDPWTAGRCKPCVSHSSIMDMMCLSVLEGAEGWSGTTSLRLFQVGNEEFEEAYLFPSRTLQVSATGATARGEWPHPTCRQRSFHWSHDTTGSHRH